MLDLPIIDAPNHDVALILGMLQQTTLKWRSELGRVGQGALVWQPVENAHSIGMLLLHMADVESYWLHEVASGRPVSKDDARLFLSEETQQYSGIWPKPPRKSLHWYYEQQDRIRSRTIELFSNRTDVQLPFKWDGRELTLRWLIHHIIHHEAYHAGQAVLLQSLRTKLSPRAMTGSTGPSTIP